MATASIDTSELEYLKSCRDKLRDITEVVHPVRENLSNGAGEEKGQDKEISAKEKLRKIKKIIKS